MPPRPQETEAEGDADGDSRAGGCWVWERTGGGGGLLEATSLPASSWQVKRGLGGAADGCI